MDTKTGTRKKIVNKTAGIVELGKPSVDATLNRLRCFAMLIPEDRFCMLGNSVAAVVLQGYRLKLAYGL